MLRLENDHTAKTLVNFHAIWNWVYCSWKNMWFVCDHFCSLEIGLNLNMPIISAGSFGLSCDFKRDLTRLLPPARKISSFFFHFWNVIDNIKPKWKTAYLYKKQNNTEDCFWWVCSDCTVVVFNNRRDIPIRFSV